jgi:hypothetical protein
MTTGKSLVVILVRCDRFVRREGAAVTALRGPVVYALTQEARVFTSAKWLAHLAKLLEHKQERQLKGTNVYYEHTI